MKPGRLLAHFAAAPAVLALALPAAASAAQAGGVGPPAAARDWTQAVAATPEGGVRMGNPAARVKFVEFSSITCPHCAEFSRTASARLRDFYVRSGQVSWEYRPHLLFPTDPGLFALLQCQGPEGFFESVAQLYRDQPAWMQRTMAFVSRREAALAGMTGPQRAAALVRGAALDQYFRRRGMSQSRIDACLADPRNLQRLADGTLRAVEEQDVTGTPTFVINGVKMEPSGWAEVELRLRAAIGG
ncbi:MAG TPA: thioredoxin domain-containing protein [Allosphingosinicella sp.]|nr:thioredoxin domain-containing protein [Allosphingosinicella sp.]